MTEQEKTVLMIQMVERYVQDALIQRIQMLEKVRDLFRKI
jgi:hypothetical protein